MGIRTFVEFTCPYCQKKQSRSMKLNSIYTHPEVIMCDEEIGGCGRYLAIEVSVKTKARVYSMQEKEQ